MPNLDAISTILDTITSTDDLATVSRMVKDRWDTLQRRVATSFRVGERVTFTARRGIKVNGNVLAVNPKNIKVKTDQGTIWNVSSTLLSKEG